MSRKKWRNKTVAELGGMLREAELKGKATRAAAIRAELKARENDRASITRPAPAAPRRKPVKRPARGLGRAMPKRAPAPLHKLTDAQLRERFAHPGLLDKRAIQAEMNLRRIGPAEQPSTDE